MSERVLIRKTMDVICSEDTLRALHGDFLNCTSQYNVLDYLSCDTEVLTRRSRIFGDTVKIRGMLGLVEHLAGQLDYVSKMVKMSGSLNETDRGLFSVKQLEIYFDIIESAAKFYAENKKLFTSDDYIGFFSTLSDIYESDEYRKIRQNTARLIEQIYNIKSVTVGFNLNAALEPYEAGFLAINEDYVKSGKLIDHILRMDLPSDGGLYSIAPIVPSSKQCKKDEYESLCLSLYNSLQKIFKKQVRQWEPEINRYIEDKLGFLLDFAPDLHFILQISKIQKKLTDIGIPMCVPEYFPKSEKRYDACQMYDPNLAINAYEKNETVNVVPNDITFDERGQIYLLTGPNSGGKSVFMRTVGIIQIMAQIGMLVPARKLRISPASAILVELSYQSGSQNDGGRFEVECRMFREIFRQVDEYSLILIDEAFSSTNPNEAVFLCSEILKAMQAIRVKGIMASHFHALVGVVNELNAGSEHKIDFLAAGVDDDEKRTYVISRRYPDGKSYANFIARQYGVSFEDLIAQRGSEVSPRDI